MTQMHLGFIPEPITVAFDKLLSSRKPPEGLAHSRKFKQIVASIDAIGLIEPLTIAKADKDTGMHLLLDGHIRMFALKELGFSSALCLVAKDDESYTYNNRINRLSLPARAAACRYSASEPLDPNDAILSLERPLGAWPCAGYKVNLEW